MARNVAVVVGALGVIGRYIVERLLAEADWDVVGLSRRATPEAPRYRHISVDLLDETACGARLAGRLQLVAKRGEGTAQGMAPGSGAHPRPVELDQRFAGMWPVRVIGEVGEEGLGLPGSEPQGCRPQAGPEVAQKRECESHPACSHLRIAADRPGRVGQA